MLSVLLAFMIIYILKEKAKFSISQWDWEWNPQMTVLPINLKNKANIG